MSSTPYLLAATDPAWRDDADYDAGALKYHNGKIYKALQASGPHRGGVRTPGDNSAYWVELAEVDDSRLVHTSGNETIAGQKIFTNAGIVHKAVATSIDIVNENPDLVKGTAPESAQLVRFILKEGNVANAELSRLAAMELVYEKDLSTKARFIAYKPESGVATDQYIELTYPADGAPFAIAPSTRDTPLSNEIVTVDYLSKSGANLMHKTGNESIGGTKTFTSSVVFQGGDIAVYGESETNDTPYVDLAPKQEIVRGGDLPAKNYNGGVVLYDSVSRSSTAHELASMRLGIDTSGTITASLTANSNQTATQKHSIIITVPQTGDPYATAPNTRETPQDNEIVTVDYLKKYVADALAVLQPQQT